MLIMLPICYEASYCYASTVHMQVHQLHTYVYTVVVAVFRICALVETSQKFSNIFWSFSHVTCQPALAITETNFFQLTDQL